MVARFWRVVTAVTGWHVAASVCYYAVYAGTPLFRTAFGLSGLAVGVVIAALTLGYTLSLVPFGVATDRFGERRTLTVGLVGLAVGTLAVALAPTFGLLLGAVFLLGAMYGSATPGTNKVIFDRIAASRQHRALGIKQIGPTVGSALGAVFVTSLAGLYVWRVGFLLAAGGALLVAGVFFLRYRPDGDAEATTPAFRGLLSNRPFVLTLAAGVCLGAAFYTTTGYTVLYVHESVGASVATGGLVLAAVQVVTSAAKVVAGTLADVLPGAPRVRTGAMLAVQAAGGGVLFLVLPLAETTLMAGLVFAGLGVFVLGAAGLYYSCLSTLVEEEQLGAASAAGQLAVTGSGLFAPPTFGYLVDASGYRAGWTFLAALSFLAAGFVVVLVLDAL